MEMQYQQYAEAAPQGPLQYDPQAQHLGQPHMEQPQDGQSQPLVQQLQYEPPAQHLEQPQNLDDLAQAAPMEDQQLQHLEAAAVPPQQLEESQPIDQQPHPVEQHLQPAEEQAHPIEQQQHPVEEQPQPVT